MCCIHCLVHNSVRLFTHISMTIFVIERWALGGCGVGGGVVERTRLVENQVNRGTRMSKVQIIKTYRVCNLQSS